MSVISEIESIIEARLKAVKFKGSAITVYKPGADRAKGKTAMPCFDFFQYLPLKRDVAAARPNLEVFEASAETQTVTVPAWRGDIELTGPASWTVRRFPIPVILHYQVELLATEKAQCDALELFLLRAIPMPFRPLVGGVPANMMPNGDPVNLDELEAPLFRRAQRYIVSNLWVDSDEITESPPITSIINDISFAE